MDSISDKVKKIRVEYEDKPLNLEDLNQDPLEQFNTWFQIAIDAEVNEANAMAISTITQEGTPRSRYVLFKDIVDDVSVKQYTERGGKISDVGEEYLKKSGVGDKAFFGPEPEFFVFDDVRIKNDMNECGFKIDSKEGPYNSGAEYPNGNMGHRPPVKLSLIHI